MQRLFLLLLAVVALAVRSDFLFQAATQETKPTPPKMCDELDKVDYAPETRLLGDTIVISTLDANSDEGKQVNSAEKRFSPHQTRWVTSNRPDTMRPGPWTTVLFVEGNKANPGYLKLEFRNHASYGVDAKWLNEKLLFLQVWWGRVGSTDLILDVETSQVLYCESASYLKLILPCDQKQ